MNFRSTEENGHLEWSKAKKITKKINTNGAALHKIQKNDENLFFIWKWKPYLKNLYIFF